LSANEAIIELHDNGYCVLKNRLPKAVVAACKDAFWPILLKYVENHGHEPNRGPHRHCLPMPFDPPCFAPEFFFDEATLDVIRTVMGCRKHTKDATGISIILKGPKCTTIELGHFRILPGE
jgi:hypothetical protein